MNKTEQTEKERRNNRKGKLLKNNNTKEKRKHEQIEVDRKLLYSFVV